MSGGLAIAVLALIAVLIGSLPIAHLAGGGAGQLVLDGRQVEEMLLTATQTLMGVALILALRFHRYTAWALLALFLVQFPIASTEGRLALSGVYAVVAVGALVLNPRQLLPTLRAPFRG